MTFRWPASSYLATSSFVRMAFLFGGFLFYSQFIGLSDLGYRASPIDVKLSQKYPPAVALEVINRVSVIPGEVSDPFVGDYKVIQLRAEYPDLGLISLDELSFTLNLEEETSKKWSSSSRVPQQSIEAKTVDYFTEEEKLRLKMAHLPTHIDLEEELGPTKELDLKERLKVLMAKEGLNASHGRELSNNNNAFQTGNSPHFPLTIQGDIEFSKGSSLALTDQHFIDVRRFEEGVPKEVAKVDLTSGTFSMKLQSTKGVIVGRLTHKSGGVDGEVRIPVLDFVNSNKPRLILKKNQRNPTRPVSTYGYGTKKDLSLSNKNENNENRDRDFSPRLFLAGASLPQVQQSSSAPAPNSSEIMPETSLQLFNNEYDSSSEFIVEATADFHRPTISFSNITDGRDVPLLPDRMMNGLSEILSEQDISLNLNRGDSLVWGIVKQKGRPLAGATVIAHQGVRTSYFGGLYLPDQTRVKTSENGMFAIALTNPGWQDLLIELEDGRHIHYNALTFAGKVSYVEVEAPGRDYRSVTFRSFDAFSGEPVRAIVEVQQIKSPIEVGVDGTAQVDMPKTQNLSFVLATPAAPYEKVRLSYTRLEDFLHIPLLTTHWMQELRTYLKIIDAPQTGAVVGFVQNSDFTVEIQNKESLSQIVYFDQRSHISQQGVAGGGFVVFNLEEDQVNLVIIPLQSKKKEIIRVIRPEREWTHIINANFE